MAWAAFIFNLHTAEQEAKMKEGPPPQLIHLFKDANLSSPDILQLKNQNMMILGVFNALMDEEEKNFAQLKILHEKHLSFITGMHVLVQATLTDIQATENPISLSYASQIERRMFEDINQ